MTVNAAALTERAEIDAVVEGKTIVDFFNRNADNYPDAPAIHWKENGDWQSLTWSEYRDVVHKAAAGLEVLGVGDGEFVAIMAGNRPEHVIADFAAVHAGATPVTIYSTLAANQIQYIADNCKATVAILEDLDFMKRWEEIRSELPNLRYVVLMSGGCRELRHPRLGSLLGRAGRQGRPATRGRRRRGYPGGLRDRPRYVGHPHLHVRHHRHAKGRDDHAPQRGVDAGEPSSGCRPPDR